MVYIYTDGIDGALNIVICIELSKIVATIAISDRMETHDHISANHNTALQHNFTFSEASVINCHR